MEIPANTVAIRPATHPETTR
jgi:hypothetical protein